MSEMPKISVVMPVFNGAKYLRHALGSLSGQVPHPGELEIIVADDGSSDGSLEILREASQSLPITLIDGAHQGNWVASTNRALQKVSGDYVCFLHQDDRFMPSRLKTLADVAMAYPDVAVIAHPVRFIDGNGNPHGRWTFPAKRLRHRPIDWFTEPTTTEHNKMSVDRRLPPSDWFPQLLVQNNLSVPGVLFKRSVLETDGYLDESLRYTADWDFWLRLAARHDLVLVPECLSEYRIHAEAQTVAFAEKQKEYESNLRIVVERHQKTLETLVPSEAAIFRKLAALGIETNIWLAARMTGGRPTLATLFRSARRAGLMNSMRYLRLSRIIPRAAARMTTKLYSNSKRTVET